MKFYKIILKEIPNEQVIPYTYGTAFRPTATTNGVPLLPSLPSLEKRIGNGECSECGHDEWMILPPEHPAVKEGGKPYIECMHCGHFTHL